MGEIVSISTTTLLYKRNRPSAAKKTGEDAQGGDERGRRNSEKKKEEQEPKLPIHQEEKSFGAASQGSKPLPFDFFHLSLSACMY